MWVIPLILESVGLLTFSNSRAAGIRHGWFVVWKSSFALFSFRSYFYDQGSKFH